MLSNTMSRRAPASMRKYCNQFLVDGQYFTWFVDARRWAEGESSIARGLLSPTPGAASIHNNGEMTEVRTSNCSYNEQKQCCLPDIVAVSIKTILLLCT